MIPSSPRLVAFAQSECDLTTPNVVVGQASRAAPRDSTHAATKQGSKLAAISTVYQSTSADVAAVRGSSALLTIQQRTGPDCCARPRAGP
jgi:hypothetical protein